MSAPAREVLAEPRKPRYSKRQLGGLTEAQVDRIKARVQHGQIPWLQRWRNPRPAQEV